MAICIASAYGYDLPVEDLKYSNISHCGKIVYVTVCEENNNVKSVDSSTIIQRSVQLTATSTIDAIFKLKKHLDEEEIVDCLIYVPEANVDGCVSVKKLLFVDTFDVQVRPFPYKGVLKKWRSLDMSDYETAVRQYLTEIPSREDIQVIKSNLIPSEMFVHGYTSRYGGISYYPSHASLNLAFGRKKTDSLLVIKENRRRLCSYMGCDSTKYKSAQSAHGKNIWMYENQPPQQYDGIICNTPGVTIAAPGADCSMVLLADPVNKACGVVHSGWIGTSLGVVEEAVKAMIKEYGSNPKNILACLGPSLSLCCCRFGKSAADKLRLIHEDIVVLKEGKNKPFLDLRFAIKIQLENCGVKTENFDDGFNGGNRDFSICTKCDPKKDFFSHKRDGEMFGNLAGFISIKD